MDKKKKEIVKRGRKKKKDATRDSKTSSTVQSVIFAKNWKLKDTKKWLKDNSFTPIGKVHITKKVGKKKGGSKKFTIIDPKDCGKLGFKSAGRGISFIICSQNIKI